MAEMLQLLETIRAEEADVKRLFGGEGQATHSAKRGPTHLAKLTEAVRFIGEVFSGRRPMWQLREAMSTSDFPLLFGDTIDRLMIADYKAIPETWRAWLGEPRSVADFRTVKRFKMDGLTGRLEEVPQGGAYPEGTLSELSYSYAVKKYGRTFHILWEAMVNDDLDALKETPTKMARAAAATEAYFATSLYAANATLFTEAHGNYSTNALTLDNVAIAIAAMDAMVDPDGNPIFNQMKYLVTGPALRLKALEICKSTTILPWPAESGGVITAGARATENVLAGMLTPLVDPMIPIVDTTYKATSWYLFADPADGAVAEVGLLRGHEMPELFMKTGNQQRVGGTSDPMDGDFDTDTIAYKVRMVIGGSIANATGGWRFGYWGRGA